MDNETRDRILDVAQELAQQRGFSAFSYRDVAEQVGIRAPSIHYYFPSKDDLGVALIERYRQNFGKQRSALDKLASARARLEKYAQLFRATVADQGKMCLCGMLASEFGALPSAMQVGVRGFFEENEVWLGSVLERGRARRELVFHDTLEQRAAYILATLEGAMLGARVSSDPARFDGVVQSLLDALTPATR